eukprot:scaffold640374_cov16-Prasinocladus_malaysianus.AAC.2
MSFRAEQAMQKFNKDSGQTQPPEQTMKSCAESAGQMNSCCNDASFSDIILSMVRNQVSPLRSALDMTKASQREIKSPGCYSRASHLLQCSSDSLFKRRHGEQRSTFDTLVLAFCLPPRNDEENQ